MKAEIKNINFLLPDFILGNNPYKKEIRRQIDGKNTFIKNYIFNKKCLSRDYGAITTSVNKCLICGSTDIENTYLRKEKV